MSLDVKKNPFKTTGEITWYKAADTTPAALADPEECASILAHLDPTKWHSRIVELYFGDNGYEFPDGSPLDYDDVMAFAFMPPPPIFI